jgi:hypothetical protein
MGRVSEFKPHQVGLQISRGVHSEVSQTNAVRATEAASGRGVPPIGVTERKPNRGGTYAE